MRQRWLPANRIAWKLTQRLFTGYSQRRQSSSLLERSGSPNLYGDSCASLLVDLVLFFMTKPGGVFNIRNCEFKE